MKRFIPAVLLLAGVLRADLTPAQKELDFRSIVASYAKHYAPYEWKRDAIKFDLLRIDDWLRWVRASRDDIEFFEICAEYVASLEDSHSSFSMPSTFQARLGFHCDIYDGKVMVDNVTRSTLPADTYPLEAGWEVVSLDGVPVGQVLERLAKQVAMANPRSRLRYAAQSLAIRSQSLFPRAHQLGDKAEIAFRDLTGAQRTLSIPWVKTGAPVTSAGKVPSPVLGLKAPSRAAAEEEPEDDIVPPWVAPLKELRREIAFSGFEDVLNVGSLNPVYPLPAGFTRRLGVAGDSFLSGTFTADGLRIGLLRIPNFTPASTAAALQQFEREIAFFEPNTDGLIVDVSRNNGGDACYNEELQRRLIPYEFRGMGREFRATTRWLNQFSNALDIARALNAERYVIALLEERLKQMEQAFRENRGRTGPVAICAESLMRAPAGIVYTKPLMVLIDDYSFSAADAFPAIIQDAGRGPLFGYRTNGAGGTTGGYYAGVYTDIYVSHTAAMYHRRQPVVTSDYPTASYVENIGVRPDIPYDMMTRENLLNGRRPYTEAFTRAIVEHIRNPR